MESLQRIFVVIIFRVLTAQGRNLATTKYEQVRVHQSSWTVFATSILGSIGECSYLCSKTYNCEAFAYDSASKTCELGPQLNLPVDADPAGKTIFFYKSPKDCRSTQAIAEGYQLINKKYYKKGVSTMDNVAAVAECASAGARPYLTKGGLGSCRKPFNSSTPYWVGAHVPTDKGTTLCNSNNGPDECKGFFKWDDASPITWTSDDIQNWSLGFLRNYLFTGSFCTIMYQRNIDDAQCSGWSNAYPICQIDCHLTDV